MSELPEQSGQRPPDLMEFWRQWLTESERQFNAFFNTAMNTDAFSRTTGSYMEVYAGFQRLLAEGMQRYLSLINMPSRSDVIGLGETLRTIEGRLARIEETLEIAAEVGGAARGPAPVREPARTRRPPEAPQPEAWEEAVRIPEQFRVEPPSFASERASGDEPPTSERLRALEERLARIEEMLRIAVELVDASEPGGAEEPARAHWSMSLSNKEGAEAPAIPEELRR